MEPSGTPLSAHLDAIQNFVSWVTLLLFSFLQGFQEESVTSIVQWLKCHHHWKGNLTTVITPVPLPLEMEILHLVLLIWHNTVDSPIFTVFKSSSWWPWSNWILINHLKTDWYCYEHVYGRVTKVQNDFSYLPKVIQKVGETVTQNDPLALERSVSLLWILFFQK